MATSSHKCALMGLIVFVETSLGLVRRYSLTFHFRTTFVEHVTCNRDTNANLGGSLSASENEVCNADVGAPHPEASSNVAPSSDEPQASGMSTTIGMDDAPSMGPVDPDCINLTNPPAQPQNAIRGAASGLFSPAIMALLSGPSIPTPTPNVVAPAAPPMPSVAPPPKGPVLLSSAVRALLSSSSSSSAASSTSAHCSAPPQAFTALDASAPSSSDLYCNLPTMSSLWPPSGGGLEPWMQVCMLTRN